jgi:hypothetical protein
MQRLTRCKRSYERRRSPRIQCRFARLKAPPLDLLGRDNQHVSEDVFSGVGRSAVAQVVGSRWLSGRLVGKGIKTEC